MKPPTYCRLFFINYFMHRVSAFATRSLAVPPYCIRGLVTSVGYRHHFATDKDASSESTPTTYDVDKEEDAQPILGEHPNGSISTTPSDVNKNENDDNNSLFTRYGDILTQVGLHDTSKLKNVCNLPGQRAISPYDVFCNRELRMQGVRAIGFDMDYTLAQYVQPAFDHLAFDGAKQKLVAMGYPPDVLQVPYNHTLWTRGLIIDTQRGNFLKIDRHKYVRVARHGLDPISPTTRKLLYSRTFNKVMSFSEKSFVNMDTLFQFVDAHLFATLIDMKDKGDYEMLDYKTYAELYKDVRHCVDLCHRDGVIKDEVARDPAKYIVLDKGLVPMLKRFKSDGVKVFLLTNSLWEYTSTAMNYLYHGARVSDDEQAKNEWLNLFDIVIVGSCKPAYMLDPYLNLFRVNPADGSLKNTDGTYEIDSLGENGAHKFLSAGKVFQGGNWQHLHAMLETEAGEEILYVGDHLYSDVLRSKRTLGWRSAFIMPELEEEMRVFNKQLPLARQVTALRQLREELGQYGENIRRNRQGLSESEVEAILKSIEDEDMLLKETLSDVASRWHSAFHPIWGAIFNSGYQDSRFGFYVQNYACVYTSRATNLGLASSERSFRTGLEMLPHDKLLNAPHTKLVDQDPWD